MAIDDKYVMNGVWLTCDQGVTPSRFQVTPKPVQLYDEHFANELDKIPLVNILPFGGCSVTRTPCMPAPVLWERVMEEGLTVLGARPLLDTSKCQCGVGGQIAIHFTRAEATAAVELDQQLDQVDELAEAVEEASGWAFWGGLAMGIGGAVLVATGVGAPLGAALITGAGYLMTASTVAATAAAVTRGATKFARDPSKEVGLSIVGEVAFEAARNYVMNKLGGKLIGKLASSKLGQRIANSRFARTMQDRFSNAFRRNRAPRPTCVGEPVDVATGKVISEALDFELGGPLPLTWSRKWYSTSAHEGALGHGWHHLYDEELYADEEVIILRLPDGRYTGAEPLQVGEVTFIRAEKISLARTATGYAYLDADGLVHHFAYVGVTDSYKLVRLEREAGGGAITFQYSASGLLAQITDSAGRELPVEHDAAGRLLCIRAPHPTEARGLVEVVRYAYDRQGRLVKAADALEQAWQFRYKGPLLVQATYKNGLSFYYEYDGDGLDARCVRTWGDKGLYACRLSYDLENYRTTVVDSIGAQRVYEYDPELGSVTRYIDARGGITALEYNEFGEVISETDALGHKTRYAYDERGKTTLTSRPDGTELQQTYDEHERPVTAVDPQHNEWHWEYTDHAQEERRLDPNGRRTLYRYEQGRLLSVTDEATGRATTLHYDAVGNLQELRTAAGVQGRWLYDNWGRVYKFTDERGNVQWREYDLLNRLTRLYEPDGNVRSFAYDALDYVVHVKDRQHAVRYAYYGLGQLARRTEAGTTVEYLYDTEERLRAVINQHGLTYRFELDPEGDVVAETGFDGHTRRYQRNVGGQIVMLMQPSGQRTTYAYDAAGRVVEAGYAGGATAQYQYDPAGELLAARNDTSSLRFERDARGNVLTETQGAYTVSSEYDDRGFRTRVTSSLGAEVLFIRDEGGNIAHLKAGTWQALFERDAQGLELQRILSGGVRTRWHRDAQGRPVEQRIQVGMGRSNERTRTYEWQDNDRLSRIHDSLYGATQYTHDALGNLASAAAANGGRQFRLPDAVGNLFETPARRDRRYGPAGQLLEAHGTRYRYDVDGNLVGKTTAQGEEWGYAWNGAGQLTEIVRPDGDVVRFAYDALGRRVRKEFRGRVTHWVWDGNQPLHEWTDRVIGPPPEQPADLVTWLFDDDDFTPIAQLTTAGDYAVVADHLGTPLALYDQAGQSAWQAETDTYGAVRPQPGTTQSCPFRYQGQYEDAETGLYYNRFRYYDPGTGTYISQDPAGLKGGLALYAYVPDPTSWVDVFGLSPSCGCGPPRKSNSWNDFQRKTKGQFATREESLAEYRRLKNDTSPWPKDYVPKQETMTKGRVRMAMSDGQPVNRPGGFATQDAIPDVQYVRDKLAVRSDWKPSVGYVQEYQIIKPVPVFKGPIGPQLDPGAGTYLPGGGSQIEFRVPPADRMKYLKPVGKPKPIT